MHLCCKVKEVYTSSHHQDGFPGFLLLFIISYYYAFILPDDYFFIRGLNKTTNTITKEKRGDTNRHIYAKNLAGKIPYFMLKYIDTALVSCK